MGLCDFKMSLGETRSLYCWWDKSAGQIHKGVARINFSYHRHKATQKNFNSPPTPLSGHGWVRKTFNNACHVLLMWVEIVALGSWIILVLIHLFCLQTTCCPCAAGQGLEGGGGAAFYDLYAFIHQRYINMQLWDIDLSLSHPLSLYFHTQMTSFLKVALGFSVHGGDPRPLPPPLISFTLQTEMTEADITPGPCQVTHVEEVKISPHELRVETSTFGPEKTSPSSCLTGSSSSCGRSTGAYVAAFCAKFNPRFWRAASLKCGDPTTTAPAANIYI